MPDLAQLTGTLVAPNLQPVTEGTISLTPEAVGYLPKAVVVQGAVTGSIVGGVLTIDPVIVIPELTYRVAFHRLRTTGGPVKLRDFSALLPAGTVDLADILPTQPDGGTRLVVDGTIVAQATAAAVRAEIAAERAEAGGGGSGPASGREVVQAIPLATWTIPHGLGRRPLVSIYDQSGAEIDTDITATATAVTVTFPEPMTGSVVLS